MSDTILRIIPADPSYIPDEIRQSEARDLFQELFNQESVEF